MTVSDRLVRFGYRHGVRGTQRVAERIHGRSPLRTVPADLAGLAWEVDPLDWMDIEILRTGSYEPEITDTLSGLVRDGDVFWDIGANAGVHAVQVAARRPAAAVVAVEPSPARYVRLVRNAAANGVKVTAFCVALADSPGYRPLSVVDTGNSGHTSLRPWPDATYESVMPCWCDTVDRLIESGTPAPTVVKIDVEGAEPLVLAGMAGALPAVRHVVFEASSADSESAVALRTAGFSVEPLRSSGGGENFLASRA